MVIQYVTNYCMTNNMVQITTSYQRPISTQLKQIISCHGWSAAHIPRLPTAEQISWWLLVCASPGRNLRHFNADAKPSMTAVVVEPYPSEKYESQLGWWFPIYIYTHMYIYISICIYIYICIYIWKNKTFSKPPTRWTYHEHIGVVKQQKSVDGGFTISWEYHGDTPWDENTANTTWRFHVTFVHQQGRIVTNGLVFLGKSWF